MTQTAPTEHMNRETDKLTSRKLAVILPVSATTIATPRTISDIRTVLRSLRQPWQIVIVRNGPLKRHLVEYLDAICYSETNIECITLGCTRSERLAIQAGLNAAEADGYIVLAADGSDDPSTIRELVRKWNSGSDCVLAVRDSESENSRRRRLLRAVYRVVGRHCSVPVEFNATDFCLLDSRVVNVLRMQPCEDRSLVQQTAKLGFRRSLVGIERTWHRKKTKSQTAACHFRTLRDTLLSHSRTPVRALYAAAFSVSALAGLAVIGATIAMIAGAPLAAIAVGLALSTLLACCPMTLALVVLGEGQYRLLQAGPGLQSYSLAKTLSPKAPRRRASDSVRLTEDQILAELNSLREDVRSRDSEISLEVDAPLPPVAV